METFPPLLGKARGIAAKEVVEAGFEKEYSPRTVSDRLAVFPDLVKVLKLQYKMSKSVGDIAKVVVEAGRSTSEARYGSGNIPQAKPAIEGQARDIAEALRAYAKQVGAGLEMQNQCAEIKVRAERRAGELLEERDKHHPGPETKDKLQDTTYPPTLKELGIERTQAHCWQTGKWIGRNEGA